MMRKQRTTITKDILKRIRKEIDKETPVKKIAEYEEISLQTLYNLVNKICNGLADDDILKEKKGRKKNDKLVIKEKISHMLLVDSSYTQKELSEKLKEIGVLRTQSSLSRILKKMDYTRKRLVKVPEERNNEKNITTRKGYAREMQFMSDNNLVFLDETGSNLNVTRNYGYSPRNVKAYKVVKGNRGKNISCMVAIKITGIIAFEIREGAFEGGSFIQFLSNSLIEHFNNNRNDILIMDNCRFHHRKDVIEFLNVNGIMYKFLPPYSPQLNPIEEYFSHFKSLLKCHHTIPHNKEELKNRITNILSNETISFTGWFLHMRTYIEKALAGHEFI